MILRTFPNRGGGEWGSERWRHLFKGAQEGSSRICFLNQECSSLVSMFFITKPNPSSWKGAWEIKGQNSGARRPPAGLAEPHLCPVPAMSKALRCKPRSFLAWTVEPPSREGKVLGPGCVQAQTDRGSLAWVSMLSRSLVSLSLRPHGL